MVGDFELHVDSDDTNGWRLNSFLQAFNRAQQVHGATQRNGHTQSCYY